MPFQRGPLDIMEKNRTGTVVELLIDEIDMEIDRNFSRIHVTIPLAEKVFVGIHVQTKPSPHFKT